MLGSAEVFLINDIILWFLRFVICGWKFPHVSAEPRVPHKVTTTNPGSTVTFYSCETDIQESRIAHASKRHCRNSCGVALVLAVLLELALLATP